jgi:hypothetical protein
MYEANLLGFLLINKRAKFILKELIFEANTLLNIKLKNKINNKRWNMPNIFNYFNEVSLNKD